MPRHYTCNVYFDGGRCILEGGHEGPHRARPFGVHPERLAQKQPPFGRVSASSPPLSTTPKPGEMPPSFQRWCERKEREFEKRMQRVWDEIFYGGRVWSARMIGGKRK